MKLSEMRQVLSDKQIQLTKSLGQNFLHDQNQLQKIAESADLHDGDRILEIGPGLGPLTSQLLLAPITHLLAVEMDQRLGEILRQRFAGEARFELLIADGLEIVRDPARNWTDWKLISNLPYSVASPILVELALRVDAPKRIVVTLQLEVAQRIEAVPGNSDYGLLTLLIQMRYQPIDSFKIPAGCFFPPPNIDSACIVLQRRDSMVVHQSERDIFVRIVRTGFSQRRKMMLKLLKTQWPEDRLKAAFEMVKLSVTARAQEATLEQFAAMARILSGHS